MRGYLLIACASLCYGASATLGKAVFRGMLAAGASAQIGPLALAQARSTISLLLLVPALLVMRRGRGLSLPVPDVLRCLLVGSLGLAASNFCYYYSIEKTTVATAIIVQYTAPVWVLISMLVRDSQWPSLKRVISVSLAVIGCAVSIGIIRGTAGFPLLHLVGLKMDPLGVGAALAAAFAFSFYSISGQSLVNRHDRWNVLVYVMLGAAGLWMIVNPPWKIVAAHYSSRQWLFLFVFALVSMLLPLSLYFAGLQYLDATRAIVTCCLEPVFAILFAATFVHESIGALQIFGIALVLTATVIVQLPEAGGITVPSEIAPVD